MIAKYLLSALLAGLVAGLLVTVAQQAKVVPLILEAETYENAAPAHNHGAVGSPVTATPVHQHEPVAMPDTALDDNASLFGDSRLLGTLMGNLVAGCGFALLLAAAALLSGEKIGIANGALWGAMGWLVFQLFPSLGLPPELPGFPAADLAFRQYWWVATVIASSSGLYFLILRREAWAKIIGLALLVAPHLFGAPQPDTLISAVPAVLAAEYAVAALATGLFFWTVLGLTIGFFNEKFVKAG